MNSFGHSFDPIRVITFWILTIIGTFFLQLGQAYGGFLHEWLVALQFPQGKEASGPQFGGAICCWHPWALGTIQWNLLFQPPWWP